MRLAIISLSESASKGFPFRGWSSPWKKKITEPEWFFFPFRDTSYVKIATYASGREIKRVNDETRACELGIIISDLIIDAWLFIRRFEVCRLLGPCKIRYARLCAAIRRVKAIARSERSSTRARRCILIVVFAYTGARVTTRNNKRDCFPTWTWVFVGQDSINPGTIKRTSFIDLLLVAEKINICIYKDI